MNFHRGDAAKANDCKPTFLRKLADWFSEWKTQQPANTQKFTLSKQTTSALVTTLRCTATLIEDLLQEGYAMFSRHDFKLILWNGSFQNIVK